MSLEGVYEPDNIFAKIVRGEMPCAKVFEDQDTLAFMDVFPQGRGHTLVVHKRSRARNLLDAEADELTAVIATVQRVARALVAALQPHGLTVTQFNGEASGQTVLHLHFHLIPRWQGTPLGRHAGGMADASELAEQAKVVAAQIL
ncbi:MAG TPA: HIT family protein [Caulobacteraceae bacterium]